MVYLIETSLFPGLFRVFWIELLCTRTSIHCLDKLDQHWYWRKTNFDRSFRLEPEKMFFWIWGYTYGTKKKREWVLIVIGWKIPKCQPKHLWKNKTWKLYQNSRNWYVKIFGRNELSAKKMNIKGKHHSD